MNSKIRKKSLNENLLKKIKGLGSVEYDDDGDENCSLQVYEDEEGLHLVTIDFDMDIYYEWVFKPGQKKPEKLIIGSPDVENTE